MKTYTIKLANNGSIKITCDSYRQDEDSGEHIFILNSDKIESVEESPKLAVGFKIPRNK